jgi:hypothetical protein
MATTTTTTNKPLNPRAQDLSPKGYNRANIFSGKALSFDGANDYVDLDGFTLSGTTATFVFNLKMDDWLSLRFIFDADSQRLVIGTGDNGNEIGVYDSTAWKMFGTITDTTSTNNFAIVVDGTTAKCFLNGQSFGTDQTITAINLSNPTNVALGSRNDAAASFLNGQIAGFKIFNTALTAAQVADLYLNPEKIVPDGVASSALKLWLPMMEGAGASAYDGSGNGNDGTINGATWTAGIGAPVAQTALVSWDKGQNRATHSEDFANGAWIKISTSVASNTATAPNGTMTADSLNSTSSTEAIYQIAQANTIDFSVYAKAGTTTSLQLASTSSFNGRGANFDLANGTAGAVYQIGSGNPDITGGTSAIESVGNGWYRCSINGLTLTAIRAVTIANNNGNLSYIWGASIRPATAGDAYIKTNATAQTSDVLVPEGLTAGASIFGTNIITPRNAFALNLDGASWGRVGRNTSVSPTTAITLEAWIKKSTKSGFHHIISRNAVADYYYSMFTEDATGALCFQGTTSANYKTSGVDVCTGSWVHVLVAYNTTQALFYVNGVLVSTNALTDALTPNSVDLFIGARPSGIQLYDAQLANPRIYNRALTAAEVLRNYNADRPKFGL